MFENLQNTINAQKNLIEAIYENKSSVVKEILAVEDNHGLVNLEMSGVPLIMYAAQKQYWDIFKELYDANADLEAKVEYSKRYLVHECIEFGPENITKAVIDYCNINSQNRNGETPLMIAFLKGKKYALDYILDEGRSDLSRFNKDGDNIAHIAAKNKDYEFLLKLIDLKCPMEKLNNEGNSPIDCIEDVAFKETLPKVLKELEGSKKQIDKVNITISDDEVKKPEVKSGLVGLSKIQKKK